MVCGNTGGPSNKYKWLSLCPTQWVPHFPVLGPQFTPQYSLQIILVCKFAPRDLDTECRSQLPQGLLPISYLLRNHQVNLRQNKDQTLLIPELRSVQQSCWLYEDLRLWHMGRLTDSPSQTRPLATKLLSGPGFQLGASAVLRISGIQCLQQNVRLPRSLTIPTGEPTASARGGLGKNFQLNTMNNGYQYRIIYIYILTDAVPLCSPTF